MSTPFASGRCLIVSRFTWRQKSFTSPCTLLTPRRIARHRRRPEMSRQSAASFVTKRADCSLISFSVGSVAIHGAHPLALPTTYVSYRSERITGRPWWCCSERSVRRDSESPFLAASLSAVAHPSICWRSSGVIAAPSPNIRRRGTLNSVADSLASALSAAIGVRQSSSPSGPSEHTTARLASSSALGPATGMPLMRSHDAKSSRTFRRPSTVPTLPSCWIGT
mmetsp:Transcript_3617/g.11326  ORF Transcript_3617/g.11326 Transcript_3617/m.11326 type:complete len:223 (-) Transcript_3617:163-831(-)